MNKKESDNYLKIVEWSDEDNCYIGTAPGLFLGGCHGKDQKKVFAELCDIVEENIRYMKEDGRPLPKATANRKYSGKIPLRIDPELHKVLSIQAMMVGESVNKYITRQLKKSRKR